MKKKSKAKKPPKKSTKARAVKLATNRIDVLRILVQSEVIRYLKSNAVQPKKELHMSRKSAMLALAAAVAACATAAQALATEEPDPEAKPEPKPAAAKKAAAEPKPQEEKPAEPPKVPAVEKKPEPAPKAVDGAGEAITFDKLKDAFKGYAEVYGVADAKAKMLKHTPEGKKTLGDIPPEKYAEAYADFKV